MSRPPVKATRVQSIADVFADGCEPGTFVFTESNLQGRCIVYRCPCGCGNIAGIPLKPSPQKVTWEWDGNRDLPTLNPSVRVLSGCKWHGYLTAGQWTFCEDSGK